MTRHAVPLEEADFPPPHPGGLLKFALKSQEITTPRFAEICQIPLPTALNVLAGKADVDDQLLLKLEKFLDGYRTLKTAKFIYDYHRRFGKMPSSDIVPG